MARYFFDINDGKTFWRDADGGEFHGFSDIRREAMLALPEIAKDKIPKDGDKQAYTVVVRDENNITVYTGILTFAGLWMGDVAIPDRDF